MQGKTIFALVFTGIVLAVSALYYFYPESGSSIIDSVKSVFSKNDEEDSRSRARDMEFAGKGSNEGQNSIKVNDQSKTIVTTSNSFQEQTANEETSTEQTNSMASDENSRQEEIQQETPNEIKHEESHAISSNEANPGSLLIPNAKMMDSILQDEAVSYDEGFIEVGESVVFCRETRPKDRDRETLAVLFLHGSQFSSTVWINIGTMQLLADSNYRAVAIDLPGQAKSSKSKIPYTPDDQLQFMVDLFRALELVGPVLVSPSKSGDYAVPFVMSRPEMVRGFVALAPTATSRYTREQYKYLNVPVLVIVGQKDNTLIAHASVDSLQHLPNKKMYVVRNTTHACYVDHPPTFHKLLLQLLERLQL